MDHPDRSARVPLILLASPLRGGDSAPAFVADVPRQEAGAFDDDGASGGGATAEVGSA